MEIDIVALLREHYMLLLFVIVGLGYLLGDIRIGGIQAGPVIGVLLVGLVFGHFGFSLPAGVATFGFALFIFSVGIEAGPTFFSAFAADGARYVTLAGVVGATAVGLALTVAYLVGFEPGFKAGLLAGALTSTPTLAGAQDAVKSGLAVLPEGLTASQALENISVGYAITYLFGTVGMILAVRFFPRIAGIDLPAEAVKLAKERGLGRSRRFSGATSLPIIRAYAVAADDVGKTVAQALADYGEITGKVLKVKRGKELLEPTPELVLEKGDAVSYIASIEEHIKTQSTGEREVLDPELLSYQVHTQEIIITDSDIVGKTLKDLDLPNEYGCFATGLTRASIEMPLAPGLPLEKGDRLEVIGEKDNLRELAAAIGFVEQDVEQTDLTTFAFGMIGGILLGLVSISFGDLSVGLGSAGGLLIVGIIIGYLGSRMPTFGRVPGSARYVLRDLGLMFFMAGVATRAGGGVADALTSPIGPILIASGIFVTLLPALVGYLVGRRLLGLNPALLLGSITGAMTSTPALNVVTEAARSSVPALGYAGTYTFANVLLTFAGALMMLL